MDRAQWLHAACRAILRRLGIELDPRGSFPSRGLVCSNHLSYLDILVYAATMPCVFVSKREVGRWPIFGLLSRFGGTIFIDRQSRVSTDEVTARITEVLESGVPVLLFPEGTSTDGSRVLRFHPSLLEAAVRSGAAVTAAAISYRLGGGEERDMCWYGDDPFLPHLLRVLGRRDMAAEVEFHPDRGTYLDRKTAALDIHEKVVAMRARMVHPSRSSEPVRETDEARVDPE